MKASRCSDGLDDCVPNDGAQRHNPPTPCNMPGYGELGDWIQPRLLQRVRAEGLNMKQDRKKNDISMEPAMDRPTASPVSIESPTSMARPAETSSLHDNAPSYVADMHCMHALIVAPCGGKKRASTSVTPEPTECWRF